MSPPLDEAGGIVLRDPWLLLTALFVPIALLLHARRGDPALRFAPAPLLLPPERGGLATGAGPLPRSWRLHLRYLPRALQVLGVLLAIVALARPAERVPLPLEVRGIDVVLCLDVSSSMAATDLDPARSRLELARAAAASFVAARRNDRIGLVTFARFPDLVCPPTLDHDALQRMLAAVEPVEADGAEDMTGIGAGVARAIAVLRRSLARSKVVIALTDGEENVATADTPDEIGPSHAARLGEQLGVRVHAIAVGLGRRERGGELVPLDTTQLRELAERTGGRQFAATDAGALQAVYAAIDELETSGFEQPQFELEDRFLPFLLVGLALLLVGRGLGSTLLEVAP